MLLLKGQDNYGAAHLACVRITENQLQRVGRKGVQQQPEEEVISNHIFQVIIHLHTIRHFYPSSLSLSVS